MRLLTLALENFKGCRKFDVTSTGENISIYGDNATGKTTLADGYFWLVDGKDLSGQADFDIKTLDSNNQPVHHVDHTAYLKWQKADGSIAEFKRAYVEKWTKPRGKAQQEFDGHTTYYWVNGVPVQKKEYDAHMALICEPKMFRTLSDPNFFNEQLTWQQRRTILLQLADPVTDSAIIAAKPDLAPVPGFLGAHSIDDYRKIIKAQRKTIGDQLAQIPVRIDELSKTQTEVPQAPADTDAFRQQIQTLQEQRARITSGGEVAEIQKRKAELEGELQTIANEIRMRGAGDYDKAQIAFRAADQALSNKTASFASLKSSYQADMDTVEQLDARLNVLREKFRAENALVFEFTGVDTCAACGQSLPADKVEAARLVAEENFNAAKSERLEANKIEGRETKARRDTVAENAESKKTQIEALEIELASLQATRDEAYSATQSAIAPTVRLDDDESYIAKKQEIAAADAEIVKLRAGNADALNAVDTDIIDVQRKLNEANAVIAHIEAAGKAAARIEELDAEQKKLAAEVERIDHELFLTDEWIRVKVGLLEESINSQFTIARFKLFDNQINGGLQEVCETLGNGVPWTSLNNGARVNVGLDIINTLSRVYEFAPPIFIDNAESVTRLTPTTGQQIRLVVSELDKTLRIDAKAQKELQLA